MFQLLQKVSTSLLTELLKLSDLLRVPLFQFRNWLQLLLDLLNPPKDLLFDWTKAAQDDKEGLRTRSGPNVCLRVKLIVQGITDDQKDERALHRRSSSNDQAADRATRHKAAFDNAVTFSLHLLSCLFFRRFWVLRARESIGQYSRSRRRLFLLFA